MSKQASTHDYLLLLDGLLLVSALVRDHVRLIRLRLGDSILRLALLVAEHGGVVCQVGQPVRGHLRRQLRHELLLGEHSKRGKGAKQGRHEQIRAGGGEIDDDGFWEGCQGWLDAIRGKLCLAGSFLFRLLRSRCNLFKMWQSTGFLLDEVEPCTTTAVPATKKYARVVWRVVARRNPKQVYLVLYGVDDCFAQVRG